MGSTCSDRVLTRQLLDAPTAKDWGVVHEIVPVDRLLARAQEIADGIAALPPLTAVTPGSHSAKSCAASSRRDWATAVLEGISAADVARAAAQNKRARSA